ncbi:MAG TPA: hypothetical protein QGF95_06625 [Candidatus Latescibacteria bacterium]|nr:hypothetical protein [Candidatus Latescibacterota bacterium]
MRLALFCLLLFCSTPCWAPIPYTPRRPDPVLESWRWRTYPELKGLGLRSMATDGRSIWFGTDVGVHRYDGVDWHAYTTTDGINSPPVNSLCVVDSNRAYAGTEYGVFAFDGRGWEHVFPLDDTYPWPVDDILAASDGSLWVATAWGAVHLSDGAHIVYTSADMATALRTIDPRLHVTVVPDSLLRAQEWTEGAGIRVVKGSFIGFRRGWAPTPVWAVAEDGPGARAGIEVGDLVLASEGNLPNLPHLVLDAPGSSSAGIRLRRPRTGQEIDVDLVRGSPSGSVREFPISDIMEDREGRIWMALENGDGIVRLDSRDDRGEATWDLLDSTNGLESFGRPRLCQTSDGIVWLINNKGGSGIQFFDGERWQRTGIAEHLEPGQDINTAILEASDGSLWIGGHMGHVHSYRNGRWQVYERPAIPTPQSRLRDIIEGPDGALWFAGLGQEPVRLDYGTTNWASYLDLRYHLHRGPLAWFTSGGDVISLVGDGGLRYGEADGLMDNAAAVILGPRDRLWALGSHHEQAATAILDEQTGRWERQIHPKLAREVDANAAYLAADKFLVARRPERQHGTRRARGRAAVCRWRVGASPAASRQPLCHHTGSRRPDLDGAAPAQLRRDEVGDDQPAA